RGGSGHLRRRQCEAAASWPRWLNLSVCIERHRFLSGRLRDGRLTARLVPFHHRDRERGVCGGNAHPNRLNTLSRHPARTFSRGRVSAVRQEQTDEISEIMWLVDRIVAMQSIPKRVFG